MGRLFITKRFLSFTDTVVTIENLKPKSEYEFHVKGVTSGGEGPSSITRHETIQGLYYALQ